MTKFFFLILFLLLSACSSIPKQRTDKFSILQGITSAKEVEFSVVAPAGKVLRFELRSSDGVVIAPDEVRTVSRETSVWVVHKLLFLRDQNREFNLYVYEGTRTVDQRLVGKGQGNQSKLKMAVISCLDDSFQEKFKIWNALIEKNPEYILMLGDNVYADKTNTGSVILSTPESLWRRYVENRLTLPFYFQEKLVPVHAVWDDHDFGKNNAGEEFEHKDASKEIFDAFFAQSLSDEAYIRGFGVGGLLSLGDFNFYFLDGRTFRAVAKDARHLGKDQHDWLVKSLKEESQPSFIIKGDQFFGGYHHFQSYEGNHPEDFSRFVNDLRELKTPFIFLSGDRHMSEIMQFPRSLFGLPSFEITSSPLHGKVYEPLDLKNPWRVVAVENLVNFTMIENTARDNHWFLEVENIGLDGKVHFRRELAVYIKDLQNNLNESRKRRSGKRRIHKSRSRRR